jgi:hypothetical protein
MKSEAEIVARIEELREKVKARESRRIQHAREHKARPGTLGIPYTRKLEGQIEGLEWVLESSTDAARPNS